jgi:hypothetical protein
VPKEVITNLKGPQMVWVPKGTWSAKIGDGGLGDLTHKMMRRMKQRGQVHKIEHMLPESPIR